MVKESVLNKEFDGNKDMNFVENKFSSKNFTQEQIIKNYF